MRSLMALLMLSAAWAYLSDLKFWKKCVLFLSAIPLAVIGNGVRITSIVVLAEYYNEVCRENLARLVRVCCSSSPSAFSAWRCPLPLAGELIWKPSRRKSWSLNEQVH